ncbi:hypothetical protein L208DRAFT_152082, partial [Tricholoma matsutake]
FCLVDLLSGCNGRETNLDQKYAFGAFNDPSIFASLVPTDILSLTECFTMVLPLVFKGPVQFSFSTQKCKDCNLNQSRTDPDTARTELDHLGPVLSG